MWDSGPEGFASFFEVAEPRLRRALVAAYGGDRGREGAAEALAYAWQNWEQVRVMGNAVGYLYRVGQSRSRPPKAVCAIPAVAPVVAGWFEPELPAALDRLSDRERLSVVLVEGYGWRLREVAELLDVSISSVQSYLERGLRKLREALGVVEDA
jgi:RNA polymerase sigma factor (sigma-70 family)